MKTDKGIKSGIVMSDIRNFTGTFADFQKAGDTYFREKFIGDFYDIQISIAESICDNFWFNSLGDSMIFIFMGKNHSKNAYAFSMCLHKYLKKACDTFNKRFGTDISFGIGIDCGDVWEMRIKNRSGVDHVTYLGNTINVVKRIETHTKIFGETEFLVGGNIYDYLMHDLYPDDYSNARLFKTNYIELLQNKPDLVLMSENILLYYIFKLKLTGIENPLPLFRYDNDLASNEIVYSRRETTDECWTIVSGPPGGIP